MCVVVQHFICFMTMFYRMRECGEDLLVDLSEVLFNELAFSRLMQDLNDPILAEKIRGNAEVGKLEIVK